MNPAALTLDLTVPGEDLQAAYSRRRAAWGVMIDAMNAAGAFKAPDHLRPDLQPQLLLETAMPLDQALAEAA